MPRTILVEGAKTFRVVVPDGAKLTFGPWSPGGDKQASYEEKTNGRNGTLRVYESAKVGATMLGVWSGVRSFREETLDYEEMVTQEKGAIIWNSDKEGYKREEKVTRATDWLDPHVKKLPASTSNEFEEKDS